MTTKPRKPYTTHFESCGEATTHAAYCVANFWLQFAEKAISEGKSPVKLSACGQVLAVDELDRPIYSFYRRKMDSNYVGQRAVSVALPKLREGKFPTVLEYFKQK